METALRVLLAPNASPMTLDGTRTHLVGHRRVAVIDPGSEHPAHLAAIAAAVADAPVSAVLVTHQHTDHAAGAESLARRLRTTVRSIRRGNLAGGDVIVTDDGALVTVTTPGHTPDHVSFHWPVHSAVFCGDLMMGGMDTALVGAPEGRLADYLDSLELLRALDVHTIYPAHGPPIEDAPAALDRYVRHRADRQVQVLAAWSAGARSPEELVVAVYGPDLDATGLGSVAATAVEAYLVHLRECGALEAIS